MSPSSDTLTLSSGAAAPSSGFDATPTPTAPAAAPSSGFDATPSSGFDATPTPVVAPPATPPTPSLMDTLRSTKPATGVEGVLSGVGGAAIDSSLGVVKQLNDIGLLPGGGQIAGLDQWIQKTRPGLAPRTPSEFGGAIGELPVELFLLHNAFSASGMAEEFSKLTNSAKWEAMTKLRTLAEGDGIVSRVVNEALDTTGKVRALANTRVGAGLTTMLQHASQWGAEGFGQTYLHTGDPEQAKTAGEWSAGLGSVLGPLGAKAMQYVADMRSGAIPQVSGLIESLLHEEPPPPRPAAPLKPSAPTPPAPPPPLDIEKPWAPIEPVPEQAPPKPLPPAPIVPAERPELPVKPARPPKPAPLEPTPLPEAPPPPQPFVPDRAPMEQRVAEQEQALAQETVASRIAREGTLTAGEVGDPDEAGATLEILNRQIEDPEAFQQLPPDKQAEVLQSRAELLRRAQPAADPRSPQEILAQVGNLDDAIKAIRERPIAEYADWNDKTQGRFTTLNDQLTQARGAFDEDAFKQRADAEAKLQNLYKNQGVASPLRRAVNRAMFADSYVVEGARNAFRDAWEGADRTGDINPTKLQGNWKKFVNNFGPERVKSVIGEDYFHNVNDFINTVAGEGDADKAVNDKIRADYQAAMGAYRKQIAQAKTIDEAQQIAQRAQYTAGTEAQRFSYEQARAEAQTQRNAAEIADQVQQRQRATDAARAQQQWIDDVQKTRDLNQAKQIAHNADRQAYRERMRAYQDAKTARETTIAQQTQAHAEAMRQHQQNYADARDQYAQDIAAWQQQKAALQRKNTLLKIARHGARGAGPALLGGTLAASSPFLPSWTRTPARMIGGALSLYGIATSPAALGVIMPAIAKGIKPETIIPLVQAYVNRNQPDRRDEMMAVPNPKGLVERGNIPIWNRPTVQNDDGSHSTEYSTSMNEDGKEVLVPTIVNGRFLTPDGKKPPEGSKEEKAMFDRAWQHYKDTGEHLGKFDSVADEEAYADALHNRGGGE